MIKKLYAIYGTYNEADNKEVSGCSIFPSYKEALKNVRSLFADIIQARLDYDKEISVNEVLENAKKEGEYYEDLYDDVFVFDTYKYIIEPVFIDTRTFSKALKSVFEQDMELDQVLTINLCHITESVSKLIDEVSEERTDLDFPVTYTKRKYGHIIHISDELTGNWEEDRELYPDTPSCLYDCMQLAIKHGCTWLVLDADAMVMEGTLPVYEW